MTEVITSRKNQKVAHIRALRLKKNRDALQEFVVEGPKVVLDAFASGAQVLEVLAAQSFVVTPQLRGYFNNAGLQETVLADDVFCAITETKSPQGILAVCRQAIRTEWVPDGTPGFYLYCDHVSDPGNLGTLIRSSAAFGAKAVIMSPDCVDVYNEKVLRSAMGTQFHVDLIRPADGIEQIQAMKAAGISLLGGVLGAQETVESSPLTGPICLVVGNEANGICPQVEALLDRSIAIPMPGGIESLNVAVAGSILLYEISKKFFPL